MQALASVLSVAAQMKEAMVELEEGSARSQVGLSLRLCLCLCLCLCLSFALVFVFVFAIFFEQKEGIARSQGFLCLLCRRKEELGARLCYICALLR